VKDKLCARVRAYSTVPFAIAILILGLGAFTFAQTEKASVSGRVTDQSNAAVSDADVQIRNTDTNIVTSVKTNGEGIYLIPSLHPGNYVMNINKPGFRVVSVTGVTLNVQDSLSRNFVLQIGSAAESVTVDAAGAVLQTQDASLGQVIEHHEIVALPLNGRNYVLLAQLSAGTTTAASDSRGLGLTGTFVSNGVHTIYNDYLLDGIDNNNSEIDFLNGTAYVVRPPVDAIEEFKVQTSNFSAEFGRSAGAVLNAVTKSGTNQLYGNVWEFARNQALDATDYFVKAAGESKGEYVRNQFGFTLGGPVKIPHEYSGVDKTFFFIDYEGTRINQATPFTSTVPTALERSSGFTNYQDLITYQSGTQTDLLGRASPLGTIFDPATTRAVTKNVTDPSTGMTATGTGFVRDPFPNNIVPANRVDPVAVGLLNLFPAPSISGIVNNYNSQPVKTDNDGEFDGRVDQSFGDRDQAFARVSYNSEPVFLPTPCPGLAVCTPNFRIGNQTTKAANVALSETHTFSSSTLNEIRVGYNHIHTIRLQPSYNSSTDISAQYGVPGIPYLPPEGGGLAVFVIGSLSNLGSIGAVPSREVSAKTQIMDNISKQLRSHSLRFGVEYDRMKVAAQQAGDGHGNFAYSGQYTNVPNGNTASTGIAQFAILPGPSTVPGGIANDGGASRVFVSNLGQVDKRRPAYAAYVQDSWRIAPRLTANLGVRWEDFPMPADYFGANANFIPGVPGSTAQYLIDDRSKGVPLSPSFLADLAKDGISLGYSANHALATVTPFNFAPRVGLAFQATRNLVVRAAYGIFYDGSFNVGGEINYPFQYALNYTPANSSSPVTADNSIGLTSNGLKNVSLSSGNLNAFGLSLTSWGYNWKIPYVQSANLSLQYLLSKNQSLTASFVSTGGRHLNTLDATNKPSLLLPPSATVTQYIPFPDFAVGPTYRISAGDSNYYGAQASYEYRFNSGFSALANYVWSQGRTDATDNLFGNGIGYRAPDLAGFGIRGDYGLSPFDARNVIHIGSTYQLPFGKGKAFLSDGRFVDAVVGGWSVSGIFTWQSGNPSTVACSITTGASSGCDALVVPGVGLYAGAHTVHHWANAAAFQNPAVVTAVGQSSFAPLGGSSQQITGPPFHRGDISLQKRWQMSEHAALEFRGDFFNITNTPNFGPPGNLNFGSAATFASITATKDSPNDPREIQLGLNFYFGLPGVH
jgi:Carboxypeptidase regulatory-like domain/TonB dependent receptor